MEMLPTDYKEKLEKNPLIKIGERLREASNREVPNKVVIAGLASIGVAALCVDVASYLHGEQMIKLTETLNKFASVVSDSGHHQAAIGFLESALKVNNLAIDSFTRSAQISAALAGEVAVIGGIDIPKIMKDKSIFYNMEGTTKISTIGSALGEFLIKCGNRFDKKIASN
jgi:hypothetical protein